MKKLQIALLIIMLLSTGLILYNAVYGVKLNQEYEDSIDELNFVINEYEMMIESMKRSGGIAE